MFNHVHEHLEAFLLVNHQWVLLGVTAEPYAFFQVVHGKKMFLPEIIHDLKHDHLFQVSKLLGPKGRLFFFIYLNGGFKDRLSKPIPGEAVHGIAIRVEPETKLVVGGFP